MTLHYTFKLHPEMVESPQHAVGVEIGDTISISFDYDGIIYSWTIPSNVSYPYKLHVGKRYHLTQDKSYYKRLLDIVLNKTKEGIVLNCIVDPVDYRTDKFPRNIVALPADLTLSNAMIQTLEGALGHIGLYTLYVDSFNKRPYFVHVFKDDGQIYISNMFDCSTMLKTEIDLLVKLFCKLMPKGACLRKSANYELGLYEYTVLYQNTLWYICTSQGNTVNIKSCNIYHLMAVLCNDAEDCNNALG